MTSSASNASIVSMKTLTIRRVPDELHREIRVTAAGKGLSMEEEARQRLAGKGQAVARTVPKATFDAALASLHAMFKGLEHRDFVEEFLAEKRERARRELAK